MKWNKFFKKSVLSKLFFMNLLVLGFIVVTQLLFQSLYFENYYLHKKQTLLEKCTKEFSVFLDTTEDNKKIMEFIEDIKVKHNVALSFRDTKLSNRIGLESYMGNKRITINNFNNEKTTVVIGSQFRDISVKKNDYIQVVGIYDTYGYFIAQKLFVNGIEIKDYYETISGGLLGDETLAIPVVPTTPIGEEFAIEGVVEYIFKEDSTYNVLSSADIYLSLEEKYNILNNEMYNEKTNSNSSADEVMIVSKKRTDGYIVAFTTLAEVNEVMGTMNGYYGMIIIWALLLVILISYIYSKLITKPLVEMSRIAKKISECDFQDKYKVTSEDEIGVLGKSLNLISGNLEKSLHDLQDSNEKLKEEMDIQRVQEEKRKELIANISHELKTPITIIQGSINGIKSGMYTTDMYEDIMEETNKLNDLVREMLEVSKLESPTFKLSKAPFDLYSIVLKEQDKLKSMIKEKNILVSIEGEDEAIVFGDEKRINQVITNLFTNAIKYTTVGSEIEVNISLNNEEDRYIFNIKNYGVTLSKDEQEKIWDSFYRTEKSRNKKFGGTGLGLAIVKRILELHKSEFGVSSDEGWVEFYFSISKCMGY